jgi:hypothetical protein
MPLTLLQRLITALTDAFDKALAEKRISPRKRQSLYRSLLHLLMGEPYILENLKTFADQAGKRPALEHLFRIMGKRCKLPQALHARIVQSVSLKNVSRTWNITKSDLELVGHIVREAKVDPHDEHHLLHRDYDSAALDWLAEVEMKHETVEIILDSEALEDMLLGVFETYKVPKSKKEPFSEVFGLCLGMASSNRVTKKGAGTFTRRFVYVEKAVPQIRAKASQSSVTPSAESIRALVETSNSLFPQLEIIGDYHSHPYRSYPQLKKYRGWTASRQDAESTEYLYRDLKSSLPRRHRMRVSFVIAIAKGRASSHPEGGEEASILRFNMAGCHVYISAYRILSNGGMTNKGVVLRRPYRDTQFKAA